MEGKPKENFMPDTTKCRLLRNEIRALRARNRRLLNDRLMLRRKLERIHDFVGKHGPKKHLAKKLRKLPV